MSKLGCTCGKTISDNSDSLPYKASVLPDVNYNPFFEWLVDETQRYVTAALNGSVDEWLLQKGYGKDYVDLKLSHGNIMLDHIHTKYISLSRDMFECQTCGRVLVELSTNNHFTAYAPDSGSYNRVLAGDRPVDAEDL
ncbi:hypothetical protein [Massilia pseudoviolaceinigra]|uniref:hypothetical protein n=1 Tax=Massilia pseudoviolaceinigra TaxID=3057165 RepID=UPI002796CBE1|nr:hypothetical protein [Massilia sp. CCM 9206]MDQ1921116.1 hypothetical protein [Massilia sp. CCM 9206]